MAESRWSWYAWSASLPYQFLPGRGGVVAGQRKTRAQWPLAEPAFRVGTVVAAVPLIERGQNRPVGLNAALRCRHDPGGHARRNPAELRREQSRGRRGLRIGTRGHCPYVALFFSLSDLCLSTAFLRGSTSCSHCSARPLSQRLIRCMPRLTETSRSNSRSSRSRVA